MFCMQKCEFVTLSLRCSGLEVNSVFKGKDSSQVPVAQMCVYGGYSSICI